MKNLTRLQLEEGMVLAADVLNYKNELICPANTVINKAVISKLAMNSIMVVKVKDEIDMARTHNEKVNLMDSFKVFEANYNKYFPAYKSIMMKCVDEGEPINMALLMSIYNNIMSVVNTGEELLDYLKVMSHPEDELTHSHCLNSALIASVFGSWLKLSEPNINILVQAGFVYDIGKLRLPYRILWKPDKLTKEEYDLVKHHTYLGQDMLKRTIVDENVITATAQHHERIDGSGYPDGLVGDQINPFAKCIAIIDAYEAMTSPRAYREPLNAFQIITYFEETINTKFDGAILKPILAKIASSQLGLAVKLKDDRIGIISGINEDDPAHPIITLEDRTTIDLSQFRWLSIEQVY